ncbi:nucleotidyl transferase AbiEii/AbiGii toxin family protein [Acetobacterium sp.]|jgi:predicted nucleotidyltransferase component of viral defense system|uniref:nucleotidyl transferase AbiEii/AbiGii toxin family protein n=1 Tax=Acetobacterium sp. TaxID=1872094 RepID=UPI0027182BBA|nr:nucleotidyl transferase AbiEii/AbiGii toxin family protein [Acetobacterium sp.]MDO9490702.1 nucleotidyl transferase AbiEii/AbiGii toxin family protein [Acetobacterium sp.]
MTINSPRQLKDWINNRAKRDGVIANTLLQSFMMERLLERIAVSSFRDNFILKGGFLIAAMIGIDLRSTMDMDTTIKGISIDQPEIQKILSEIIAIDLEDHVNFNIKGIKSIHDTSEYDDFRVSLEANFFTIKVNLKIDITTGDVIIPGEVDYAYKLMFEEREISIKAYNLNTILAEKIESILVRNISNTRARDYYDLYILAKLNNSVLDRDELKVAIRKKAEERDSTKYLDDYVVYLDSISESQELRKIWNDYSKKYPYAENIEFDQIIETIRDLLASFTN